MLDIKIAFNKTEEQQSLRKSLNDQI
jgi:hypothetical protein